MKRIIKRALICDIDNSHIIYFICQSGTDDCCAVIDSAERAVSATTRSFLADVGINIYRQSCACRAAAMKPFLHLKLRMDGRREGKGGMAYHGIAFK